MEFFDQSDHLNERKVAVVAKKNILLIILCIVSVSACGDDEKSNPVSGGDAEFSVPEQYAFDSRFEEGQSSVSYSGQVVRNLLVQDLKILIGNLGKDGAQSISVQELLNLYAYDDALNLLTLTSTGSKTFLEGKYSSISTGKNLDGKISKEIVIGYGKTADELVRGWLEVIAENSQDGGKLGTPAVYTDNKGVDLSQMVNKVLIGAVPYYQATGVYMDDLLNRENGEAKSGKNYTLMEHAWDEAFGYFGAARDYGRYTDEQLAGKTNDYTYDSNGDGKIDFKSEYNFGLSRNAGKRDKGGSGVDFTNDIFQAFLTGRTAISNQASQGDIAAERLKVVNGMEKVIAATVVHYINDTLADMSEIGTASENRVNLNKHWAEMKAYAVALQFNPFKIISDSQLEELQELLGEAPVYDAPGTAGNDAVKDNLEKAKSIFEAAYNFSSINLRNW